MEKWLVGKDLLNPMYIGKVSTILRNPAYIVRDIFMEDIRRFCFHIPVGLHTLLVHMIQIMEISEFSNDLGLPHQAPLTCRRAIARTSIQ